MSILPIIQADAQRIPLADESVDCVVTSPAYYGLRDYGADGDKGLSVFGGRYDCEHDWQMRGLDKEWKKSGSRDQKPVPRRRTIDAENCDCSRCGAVRCQLGHERLFTDYIDHIVTIMRDVRRVLRKSGSVWLTLGDSYASNWPCSRRSIVGQGALENGTRVARPPRMGPGLKDKDLIGIPWRVAFSLQADGWWLRRDAIAWSKPNGICDSAMDRPMAAHEYVFLLTRAHRYNYYPQSPRERSVWEIPLLQDGEGHPATFPLELARRCVALGSKQGDIVLDPFVGSGTTLEAAYSLRRVGIGLDSVWNYCHAHAAKRYRRGVAKGRQEVMAL